MSNINFDATNIEPSTPLEPVPAGFYNVVIESSEIAATANKEGTLLKLVHRILDGEYTGRKFYNQINLQNKNPVAERIGQEQLSAICHAVGVIRITDTSELHEKPLQAKVSILPQRVDKNDASKVYDPANDVKGYKPCEGGVTAGPAPAAATTAPATQPPQPILAPGPPTPPVVFTPPQGWIAHPTGPGYYWNQATNEVLSEADMKVRFPAAPPVPPPIPGQAAAGGAPWNK